jgi:hypothetical protein
MEGRAVARVLDPAVTRGELRGRGWMVGEFSDPAMVVPYRTFSSLAQARARAARDLPEGTAVGWVSAGGVTVGGFVVGDDTIAPPIAHRFPAFVLWPDATEHEAASTTELSTVLHGRMDWLCHLAIDRGLEPAEVTSGRAEAEQALDVLVSVGTLTAACYGPLRHPVHPDHAGRFLSCWRDGVQRGAEARRRAQ